MMRLSGQFIIGRRPGQESAPLLLLGCPFDGAPDTLKVSLAPQPAREDRLVCVCAFEHRGCVLIRWRQLYVAASSSSSPVWSKSTSASNRFGSFLFVCDSGARKFESRLVFLSSFLFQLTSSSSGKRTTTRRQLARRRRDQPPLSG